jgi:subtilisin family serine protease
MDPLIQTKIQYLMKYSEGRPEITIGLIDGSIDLSHPAFRGSIIRTVKESGHAKCTNTDSISCRHGTFIAGIISAKRGFNVPAICPKCTLLLYPIFTDKKQEEDNNYTNRKKYHDTISFTITTPTELSNAIVEVIYKGARIINLSLGLPTNSLIKYNTLQEAYDYARKKGVIIVASSGNQGNIGSTSLIDNK